MGKALINKGDCCNMKNSKIWLIVSGGLAGIFIVLAVSALVSLIVNVFSSELPQPLENGAVVHFEQEGSRRIFIEDRVPPRLSRHNFTFINTVTGERVESRAPAGNLTYDIMGRHGRLVANVTLGPGSYIIEFEPWEGSGVFVWGDTFDLFTVTILRIVFMGTPAYLFSIMFIVLLTLHIKRKKDEETAAFFEKIRRTGISS